MRRIGIFPGILLALFLVLPVYAQEAEIGTPEEQEEEAMLDDGKGEDAALDSEAEIKKPDHPDSSVSDKLIFVGDSRTVMMRDAVGDGSIWSCKVGAGYAWMSGTGVPDIEDEIDDRTAVIFWMGVNDPDNIGNYIDYVNYKANEWDALGAKVYYASVGPLTTDPYVTNEQVAAFNQSLQANLVGVTYIDVYEYLMENGFSTLDGIHYPDSVSIAVYNYILTNLEETRSGIWG